MLKLLTIGAALVLAGCNATMPERQITEADDPARPCFTSLPTNERWSMLNAKIPLDSPRQATLQMLADSSKPSDQEREALSQWANARKLCADMGLAFRHRHAPPGVASVYDRQQTALLQAIAALYAGDLTYGQFNVQRQRIGTQTNAEYDSLRSQQVQQASQAQSDALQTLQLQQLLQASQPRPRPLPMPTPPQTVNCNSQQIGNQVHTTCR